MPIGFPGVNGAGAINCSRVPSQAPSLQERRRPSSSLIYALNNLTSLDPGLRRFCLPLEVRHAPFPLAPLRV